MILKEKGSSLAWVVQAIIHETYSTVNKLDHTPGLIDFDNSLHPKRDDTSPKRYRINILRNLHGVSLPLDDTAAWKIAPPIILPCFTI